MKQQQYQLFHAHVSVGKHTVLPCEGTFHVESVFLHFKSGLLWGHNASIWYSYSNCRFSLLLRNSLLLVLWKWALAKKSNKTELTSNHWGWFCMLNLPFVCWCRLFKSSKALAAFCLTSLSKTESSLDNECKRKTLDELCVCKFLFHLLKTFWQNSYCKFHPRTLQQVFSTLWCSLSAWASHCFPWNSTEEKFIGAWRGNLKCAGKVLAQFSPWTWNVPVNY